MSHESPLLAEDLMLCLFQPRHGTIAGEGTLYYVLAGALVAELAQQGSLQADDGGLVTAVGDAPVDDLLRPAWDYVADKPRNVQTVLAAIGPTLREPVLDRLVARGDISRTRGKALGFVPTTKLADGKTGHRAEIMADVRAALVDGTDPSPRTAALAALISGSGALPQFHPEIPWNSAVIARAKELEHGNWGAAAAGDAVTRTMTAIVVNSVVVATTVLPQN